MERGELIYSFDIAHSAMKIHNCFSISSLNFKDKDDNGILFLDLVRRGKSVQVPINRNLDKATFKEVSAASVRKQEKQKHRRKRRDV